MNIVRVTLAAVPVLAFKCVRSPSVYPLAAIVSLMRGAYCMYFLLLLPWLKHVNQHS